MENDLRGAVAYLELGLLALNSLADGNDRWHPAFLLLGFGTEKLGKVAIVLDRLNESGDLPTEKELRNSFRHDLRAIRAEVLAIVERRRDGAQFWDEEMAFVNDDTTLRGLIHLWSEFGSQGRYESLSAVLSPEPSDESVLHGFHDLERTFFDSAPEWSHRIGKPGFAESFYPALNAHLTATVQRYLRLHALLFVRGMLGRPGQILSPHLSSWAGMMAKDLPEPRVRLNWGWPGAPTSRP